LFGHYLQSPIKTKNRNNRRFYLQNSNNRWKWMAGATAATAAGVTASQAGAITINLVNNYISASGGNHLNADLTGDGHPDLTIANAFNRLSVLTESGRTLPNYTHFSARVNLNGILAAARRTNDECPFFGTERLGSRVTGFNLTCPYFYGTYQLTGSIPLFFKDLHINGGAPITGLLQVTVSTANNDAEIRLDSFTYNTPLRGPTRAVPDQGPSLALLAMGAAGILAFRRWRATQEHS
jgi:hypothetical protein